MILGQTNIISVKLILIYTFILIFEPAFSQSDETASVDKEFDIEYIRWIDQYPPLVRNKEGVTQKIAGFLFDEQSATVAKPVSVLAKNIDSFWILDQGRGTVIHTKDKKGEIPQSIKKFNEDFTSLVGACQLDDDEILFTESRMNKVYRLKEDSRELEVFASDTKLDQPTGIAYSVATGEVYVVETNAHRICVFNKDGDLLHTIGKRGREEGQFNYPTSIWIDKDGNVYIVDSMNFRVQIFDKSSNLVSVFGEVGDATGYLARPKGIAVDSYGNIYLVDALFHVVQIFDKKGTFLYKFGDQGREAGQFWLPSGIYIDEKDCIYVADSYNSRVQMFQFINGELNNERENN